MARVNQFYLLAAFYGQIVIPQAVYDEVVVRGEGRDGSREVKEATWIDVQVPRDELAVRALERPPLSPQLSASPIQYPASSQIQYRASTFLPHIP